MRSLCCVVWVVAVSAVHALGMPRWRGGPMHYAAQVGWAAMARVMAEVAGESRGSWVMAEHLARALEGETE